MLDEIRTDESDQHCNSLLDEFWDLPDWSCSMLDDSPDWKLIYTVVACWRIYRMIACWMFLQTDNWSRRLQVENAVLKNDHAAIDHDWSLLMILRHAGWFFRLSVDLVACWRILKSTDHPDVYDWWFFRLSIDLVACWRILKSTDDPAPCWMILQTVNWSSSLMESLQVYWVILLALLHDCCFAGLNWTRKAACHVILNM